VRHDRSGRFAPAMLKFVFWGTNTSAYLDLSSRTFSTTFARSIKKTLVLLCFSFFPFEQREKGATTFGVNTFSIMTISIIELIVTLSIKGIQHNDTQKK